MHFLQPVISKTIRKFLKITLQENLLVTVLFANGHISESRSIIWTWFWYQIKAVQCSPYNDTKYSFYPKCHLFPVLWKHITHITFYIMHKNIPVILLVNTTSCDIKYYTYTVLSLINALGALQFFKRGMFIRGKFSMQKCSV